MDPSILQQLERIAREPPPDTTTKRQLHEAARDLMHATESPHDLTQRVCCSQILITIVKVASDLGIFKALDSKWELTTQQLSQEIKAETLLTSRIVRGLAAHRLVVETPDGKFSANSATKYFAEEFSIDAIDHNQITVGAYLQHLPEFISINGGGNIEDKKKLPFQLAFNTTETAFDWLPTQPPLMKAMVGTMISSRAGQRIWFADPDCFSTQDFSLSSQDAEDGRALMVDVGGGAGQQSVNLRESHPELLGKIVLQDVPPLIDSLPKDRLSSLGIELQGTDFFQSQPVKGAKTYYLRNVLHDWSDSDCLPILSHIRKAMASDSLLVVDEMVGAEDKSNWKQVNYDIIMMACLGGMERTLTQFTEPLARTGFKIRDVKQYDANTGDSVLFAVPI